MQEVAYKLQTIKQIYKESMKLQGHSFQIKLESIEEKLYKIESKLVILDKKMSLFKTSKQTID